MFAVVRTGAKQYRVEPGMQVELERLPGNAGDSVQLKEVLLVGDGENQTVGQPLVAGASVKGEILSQKRGPKLIAFKKIRRLGKQWKKGHRQELTRILITNIEVPS